MTWLKQKFSSLVKNTSPSPSHSRGLQGEALAALYLKKQGYRILEKRFRYRYGEIDLIAQKKDRLAFVEVKTRSQNNPLEAINPKKLLCLERTAYYYLSKNPQITQQVQDIECLAVAVFLNSKKPKIEVIRLEDY